MLHIDPTLPSHKTYRTIFDCDSTLCAHCMSPESVAHFLLHWRRYTSQRRKMCYKVGVATTSVPQLLSNAEVIPHTLHYIAKTARFEKYLDIGSNS